MKKFLLLILFSFLFSAPALADGGIPFVLLMFPLSSVFLGLFGVFFSCLLFCWKFSFYRTQKQQKLLQKKWIYKKIIFANLISSLAGFGIILFLEVLIPPQMIRMRCDDIGIMCDFLTPGSLLFSSNLNAAFMLNMIVCFLLSFIIEFWYLKRYIESPKLIKVVFLFNLLSYAAMAITVVPLLLMM